MSPDGALLVAVVVAALGFAWLNGFHDAANAVATSLSTGALTGWVALSMAAVLNGLGAVLGVGIAELVGTTLFDPSVRRPGAGLALAALIAAAGWNVATWYYGLPSSSSQALIAAVAGAGTAAGAGVEWDVIGSRVALPMLVSPVIGFVGAWLLMVALTRVFRDAAHGPAIRGFRMAQGVSAAAMAVGHGLQDGQKTMGIIVLALVSSGHSQNGGAVPVWVRLSVASALALGTLAGGWRIIRTLARRVVPVDPVTGFAAQSVAASVLYLAAGVAAVPVSSTHTVTSAIIGAGSTQGLRAIRWRMVSRIAVAWVCTPVVTFAVAAALFAAAAALLPGS